MKKAEFKQFMLEKGERVCLYVACGLAGLLLVFFLFKPGSGLFSGSASANAEALKKKAQAKEQERRNATMKETDKPPALTEAFESFRVKVVRADDYPSRSMFFVPPKKDTKRQQPDVFAPGEFQVVTALVQTPALEYQYGADRVPEKVYVIKAPGDAGAGNTGGGIFGMLGAEGMMGGGPPGAYSPSSQGLGGLGKGSGYGGGMGGMGGMDARGGFGGIAPPGSGASGQPPADVKTRAELVKLEEAEQNRWPLATRVWPLRMAIVSASFPYKQQVEEFRQKLRQDTHGTTLSEQLVDEVTVNGRKTWKYRPSFQFRGFEVERAEVVPGEELGWVPIDLEGPDSAYRQIIIHTNKNFEPEDPKHRPLEAVSRGLVMGLPRQFRPGLYPKLTDKLENIQRTLDKLKEEDNKKIIVSKPKNDDFDVFDPTSIATAAQFNDPSKGPYLGGMMTPPPTGGMGEGWDPYGVIQGNAEARAITITPIDHCLMRFVDVTVQPGKSYRYRLRIKMANPNYSPQPSKRKDTYVQYARVKELFSPWVEVPQTVRLPAEEVIYAVDQKNLEPRLPRVLPEPTLNQVAVQFQKWVDYYRRDPAKNDVLQPVGEWLVFPRLLVERGEYVRTNYEARATDPMTEVPVKSIHSFNFELDYQMIGRNKSTLMKVMFGGDEPARQSAVLVDFDRGKARHERTTMNSKGKPETKTVEAEAATEVLMVRPDGTVIARNSVVDDTLPERVTRYASYRDRIKGIKEAKSGGGTPTNPMNPPGSP